MSEPRTLAAAADAAPLQRPASHPEVVGRSFRLARVAIVRPRMGPRREQGEEGNGEEVAQRRLGPMYLGDPVEPRRLDEEDDPGDRDLAQPAENKEERREHDPPEAQLGETHGGPEVEHVPGDPEEERPDENRRRKRGDRDGEPAGDERPDPKDAQRGADDRVHLWSLRERGQLTMPRTWYWNSY
jgi:hypothetical protein